MKWPLSRSTRRTEETVTRPAEPRGESARGYERPWVFDVGRVKAVTLGSSSSGSADSNSHYYW